MDTIKAQQNALDDALVAPANRFTIQKCNYRLSSTLKSNEPTIQVVLDALKLTPFYNAFQITASVPEIYMQEDMLQICPHLPGQKFEDPQYEKEILSFIRDLSHTGEIQVLTDVNVNHLVYQVENKNSKKNNDMCYPRFTKVIIDYFMSKDPSISRRNKMFWHTARDDPMFITVRVISKHQDTQIYGALLPQLLTSQAMLESEAYNTFNAYATGPRLNSSAKVAKPAKEKQPAKTSKAKSLNVLSEVALTKAKQMKLTTKRSLIQSHSSYASGLGDGVGTQSKVLDELQQKVTGTNKGAGDKPEVPDVPKYTSENEHEKEEDEDEKAEDEETYSDQRVYTPPDYEHTDEKENQEGDGYVNEGEQEDEAEEELYGDLNLNLERSNVEMTNAQDSEDAHVTLTAVPPVVQQQSSSLSSNLVSKYINPSPDTGIDSILNQNVKSHNLVDVPVSVAAVTPFSATTIPQPPVPIIQTLQQTPTFTTTTTYPTTSLPDIPNFASVFRFEERVSALETDLSAFKQTSQFAEAISSIPGIVDNYLASKMKDAVEVAVQLQSDKDQVKARVSKIMPKVEKYVTETLGAEVLVRSTNQPQTSYAKHLYNALVEAYNSDRDILSAYGNDVTLKRGRDDEDKDEEPSAGSNRGSKRRRSGKEPESSKEPKHKESKSTGSSKGASRSQPKSSGKSAHVEEHSQKVDDLEEQPHQEFDT
ncbi:hypothetical protein Tco_1259534 [Tanacetum coccineum]